MFLAASGKCAGDVKGFLCWRLELSRELKVRGLILENIQNLLTSCCHQPNLQQECHLILNSKTVITSKTLSL